MRRSVRNYIQQRCQLKLLEITTWKRRATYDASCWIDWSRKSVHPHDMGWLVIPWAVLAPVRGRNFVPGIVEGAVGRENLHGCSFEKMPLLGNEREGSLDWQRLMLDVPWYGITDLYRCYYGCSAVRSRSENAGVTNSGETQWVMSQIAQLQKNWNSPSSDQKLRWYMMAILGDGMWMAIVALLQWELRSGRNF